MTLEEIIQQALEHTDEFDFYASRSKAKHKKVHALSALKKLRDFLNKANLNDIKVT